jgi:tetratricopeptide (TPR) repeat protein
VPALIDLGHAAYAQGRTDDAAAYLARAARHEPGNVDVLRSVIAVHRRGGHPEAALETARLLVEQRPEDVGATLEVAELSLELGRPDDAADAYQTLRRIDAEVGHEVYAYHGLIAVELRRQDWRRALSFAIDAARVDRQQRTTDLLAFAAARVFGPTDRPPPAPAQVERIIAESIAEHRVLHVEPLAF